MSKERLIFASLNIQSTEDTGGLPESELFVPIDQIECVHYEPYMGGSEVWSALYKGKWHELMGLVRPSGLRKAYIRTMDDSTRP